MLVRLRYVTARKNKRDGTTRWYWQRKGHPLTRLPDNEAARMAMANKLNQLADQENGEALLEGSIGWVVAKYKASESYTSLAKGTTKYYDRYLLDIEEIGKTIPFSSLKRRDVVDFVETYMGKGEPRKVAAVFRNLYNIALYYECASTNFAAALKLGKVERRDQFWRPEDEKAWLEAAAEHPKGADMTLAFQILIYAVQRPSDVLSMGWTQYNGDTIKLRQQKTRKLLEVPCHRDLRKVLDETREKNKTYLIVTHQGRGLSYPQFNHAFSEISLLAGTTHLQPRDLRRTAMLRMAEAGATESQIASVSGHSIESTRQILETYLPRNVSLAREAIRKLEDMG